MVGQWVGGTVDGAFGIRPFKTGVKSKIILVLSKYQVVFLILGC